MFSRLQQDVIGQWAPCSEFITHTWKFEVNEPVRIRWDSNNVFGCKNKDYSNSVGCLWAITISQMDKCLTSWSCFNFFFFLYCNAILTSNPLMLWLHTSVVYNSVERGSKIGYLNPLTAKEYCISWWFEHYLLIFKGIF